MCQFSPSDGLITVSGALDPVMLHAMQSRQLFKHGGIISTTKIGLKWEVFNALPSRGQRRLEDDKALKVMPFVQKVDPGLTHELRRS
jgi:hypothetical protein